MTKALLLFISVVFLNQLIAQTENPLKTKFISQGAYLLPPGSPQNKYSFADSLTGFDETAIRAELYSKSVFGAEYANYIKVLKRRYINNKYNLNPPSSNQKKQESFVKPVKAPGNAAGKGIGNPNMVNIFPCVNEDFEASPVGAYTTSNAVTGWTVTSMTMNGCTNGPWTMGSPEFSIVSTPYSVFPAIGTIGNSPLGGSKVARLNNYVNNSSKTKLATTFPVTTANTLFRFAYAAYFSAATNGCCDSPGFYTNMVDCNNNTITCGSMNLTPGCNSSAIYTLSTGSYWTNWVVKSIDLTPYIGTCVTFECWCNDNTFGGSYGSVLFDAQCGSSLSPGLTQLGNNAASAVNYCQGSGIAQLTAPPGYTSYSWTPSSSAPTISPSQASLAAITVSNPVASTLYSVTCVSAGACTVQFTYILTPSQVNIIGYGSSPTCSISSAGTASVQVTGSSIGYNYVWTNSSNSVVSTVSTATALAAGIYSVTVSAPNNTACGTAMTTVTVQTGNQPPVLLNWNFCSSAAYLFAGLGSNFQWYNGSTPISAPSGTAQSITINNPTNYSIYRLGYTYQGCRDSAIFSLVASPPATINAQLASTVCPGVTNASVVINFTPVPNNTLTSLTSFTAQSTGTNTAPYSYSSALSPSTTSFTLTNLSSGAIYSLVLFDGACYSNKSISINPVTPLFGVAIGPVTGTVCSGNAQSLSVTTSSYSTSQYNFQWTPTTFLSAGNSTMANVVISPTAVPGITGTIIYTVVATPIIANCPVSNTYSLHYANPSQPVFSPIPAFCNNAPAYTVNVTPTGGTFTTLSFTPGVITPTLMVPGTSNIGYAVSVGSCVASNSATIVIYPVPSISTAGSVIACLGQPVVLQANGANTYTWSNGQTGASTVVFPSITSTYTVAGTSTLGNCQSTATVAVAPIPLPNLLVAGNLTLCAGESTTLTVSGSNTYTWSNGSNAPAITISPAINTSFSVSGTNQLTGCENTVTLTVIVNKCTSLTQVEGLSEAPVIYPNPFSGEFTIEINGEAHATIYNNLGQLICTKLLSDSKNTINLSAYSKGVYYLKCQAQNKVYTLKLIKHD